MSSACPHCGRPLDEHDRHIRLVLPDPVLDVPEDERADKSWGEGPLLQVDGVGAFVRVLLRIALTDGYSLTIGTWLVIDPAQLGHVLEIWNTSQYSDLTLDGFLGNAIQPWGDLLLGTPATARVRDPDELPYVSESTDPLLNRVLTTEWPHDLILQTIEGNT